MLPNIKTESAVLKKCLAAQYGLSLATHQTNELVARMKGFGDYQELLRGIDKLAPSIFDTDRTRRAAHAVTTAHYFSGEDEVCYFLAHILNQQGISYFTVEARGGWRQIPADKSLPSTMVVGRGEYMDIYRNAFPGYSYKESIAAKERGDEPREEHADRSIRPHFSCASNHLIAASPIFSEVMLLEHENDQRSAGHIAGFAGSRSYEAGIISTGEGGKWTMATEFAAWSEFSCVYHVAISQTYANLHHPEHVVAQIHALRKRSPDARIVAWIFEDDCAVKRPHDRSKDGRRIFNEQSKYDGLQLVDGLGWVESSNKPFFESILDVLNQHQIPFIKVPHYSGHECFLAEQPHPRQIAERDRVTTEVVRQLVDLGLNR
ncbi:hypothetical protein [Ralstonia pickettii]|uniref:hypothetical protein n=1 Tax=Ralstonia pickettii TaxID=329 RepID=UPI002D7686DF|nr:hypothetical protein [Ralstonia pickettii]